MNKNTRLKITSHICKFFIENKICKWAFLVIVAPFVTPDMLNSHSLVRRFSTYITPPVAASGFFSIAFAACLQNFAVSLGGLDGLPGAKYHETMEMISLGGRLMGGGDSITVNIHFFDCSAFLSQCDMPRVNGVFSRRQKRSIPVFYT